MMQMDPSQNSQDNNLSNRAFPSRGLFRLPDGGHRVVTVLDSDPVERADHFEVTACKEIFSIPVKGNPHLKFLKAGQEIVLTVPAGGMDNEVISATSIDSNELSPAAQVPPPEIKITVATSAHPINRRAGRALGSRERR